MLLCRGRYHGCTVRDEVLRFHRRLIEFRADESVVNARTVG